MDDGRAPRRRASRSDVERGRGRTRTLPTATPAAARPGATVSVTPGVTVDAAVATGAFVDVFATSASPALQVDGQDGGIPTTVMSHDRGSARFYAHLPVAAGQAVTTVTVSATRDGPADHRDRRRPGDLGHAGELRRHRADRRGVGGRAGRLPAAGRGGRDRRRPAVPCPRALPAGRATRVDHRLVRSGPHDRARGRHRTHDGERHRARDRDHPDRAARRRHRDRRPRVDQRHHLPHRHQERPAGRRARRRHDQHPEDRAAHLGGATDVLPRAAPPDTPTVVTFTTSDGGASSAIDVTVTPTGDVVTVTTARSIAGELRVEGASTIPGAAPPPDAPTQLVVYARTSGCPTRPAPSRAGSRSVPPRSTRPAGSRSGRARPRNGLRAVPGADLPRYRLQRNAGRAEAPTRARRRPTPRFWGPPLPHHSAVAVDP